MSANIAGLTLQLEGGRILPTGLIRAWSSFPSLKSARMKPTSSPSPCKTMMAC